MMVYMAATRAIVVQSVKLKENPGRVELHPLS